MELKNIHHKKNNNNKIKKYFEKYKIK